MKEYSNDRREMAAKNLMNDWYGYDKKIIEPETRYSASELNLYRAGYSYYAYNLSPKVAEFIKYYQGPKNDKQFFLNNYIPACDGLTDDDFITWCNEVDTKTEDRYRRPNRDYEKELPSMIGSSYYYFFSAYALRSDSLFRSIELNEFLGRSTDDQTFEEFLTTDTEYKDCCKNLTFNKYAHTAEIFRYGVPEFLTFTKRVNLKTKRLLLPLTKEDILKLYDADSNPLKDLNKENQHSYAYASAYVDAALNGLKTLEIEEMSASEISDIVMMHLLKDLESLRSRDSKGMILTTLGNLVSTYSKIAFNAVNFKRNFAYIVSTGILEKLTPLEIMALVYGFENPDRWAITTPSGVLETVCLLIENKKISAEAMCRIIATVMIERDVLIDLNSDDNDYSALETVPPQWAAATLAGKRKNTTNAIEAIEMFR